jgi:uncharacterized membrane protein YfcA
MIILIGIASTFTSASGIGGGAINSVLLMYFNSFSPKKAFPISNFIILTSSIAVFYLGVKKKNDCPSYSFIDYDAVLIFIPMLALGSKIGEFLAMITPAIFLDIVLFVFILFSLFTYYKK